GGRYPHELSGGQRQRVGVARALAADPVVLLMDEPFSAVDPIVRARLQEEFLRLQADVRKTIVLVTHDLDEAVRLGDQIAVLSEGGHLEQYGPPAELLGRPASDFVREFVGTDRGVRRLAVTPVTHVMRPVSEADDLSGVPSVPRTATLYDALAAMLTEAAPHLVVHDDDAAVGVITRSAIFESRDTDSAAEPGGSSAAPLGEKAG
ncbi:MAG TPA: ATP-binding cassette domain-containing protein, partial [Pilimelia sp.]|nr:ATP-binding cassette domain-containing protein [Pilimelia sp.]